MRWKDKGKKFERKNGKSAVKGKVKGHYGVKKTEKILEKKKKRNSNSRTPSLKHRGDR